MAWTPVDSVDRGLGGPHLVGAPVERADAAAFLGQPPGHGQPGGDLDRRVDPNPTRLTTGMPRTSSTIEAFISPRVRW
jgi:hypothetical protein